jgi:hypothetical protein
MAVSVWRGNDCGCESWKWGKVSGEWMKRGYCCRWRRGYNGKKKGEGLDEVEETWLARSKKVGLASAREVDEWIG